MLSESWYEQLEAYLDGELDKSATDAFEKRLSSDPEMQNELAARLRFHEQVKKSLREDLSKDMSALKKGSAVSSLRRDLLRRDRRWQLLALAAVLIFLVMAPRMLRNWNGGVGPHTSITINGPVTVVRFGEEPKTTTELETGCFDFAAGACR